MASSLVVEMFRHEAEFLSGRAEEESWKLPHGDAMMARDVEDLIEAMADLANRIESKCDKMRSRLESDRTCDIGKTGKTIARMFFWTEKAFDMVSKCVPLIRSNGYALDNEGQLAESRAVVERCKGRIFDVIPRIDADLEAKADAEYAAGEWVSLESVIYELRNPGVAVG